MNILLLTDGIYPYVLGGMQKHSYNLLKYFNSKDISLTVVHCSDSVVKDEMFHDDFKDLNRNIITFKHIVFPVSNNLPGHYLRDSYSYSESIFNTIESDLNKYDFIYSKGFSAWKLLEEKQKGLKCPPISVNFHGYEMFQKPPNFKNLLAFIFFLRQPVLKNTLLADFVFSYGGKIDDIVKRLGVEESKILSIPSGIEEKYLVSKINENTSNKLHFVFVGRYERRKGIEELNAALKTLLNKNFKIKFSFIGPIEKEKQINHTDIIYHGKINTSEEVFSIVDNADVLVCPSHSEGMPNVILEAMARGLAIIATNVGAVSLMVNHENGILMDNSSKENIINALIETLGYSPEILTRKKKKSLERVKENFTWNKIVDQTIQTISNKIKH